MDGITHNEGNETDLLVDTACLAALSILANGGETYRAEETAERICLAGGIDKPEVFALPTGIFVSVKDEKGNSFSALKRLKRRSCNMQRLERANQLSRDYGSGKITLEECRDHLARLNEEVPLHKTISTALACGIASAFFALLLEGTLSPLPCLFDGAIALLCGFIVQIVSSKLSLGNTTHFLSCLLSGMIIAGLAVGAKTLFGMGDISAITVGALTPLFPGLAMTTAIRDTATGDFVSGNTRILEVVVIALGLAVGVVLVLMGYVALGGKM